MYNDPERESAKDTGFVFILGVISMVICAVLLAFELFTAFYKAGPVFENLVDASVSIIVILPFPISLFSVSGGALQIYYVMLLTVMAVSVILVFVKSIPKILRSVKGGRSVGDSALFEVSVLFGVTTGFSVIFTLLLSAITGSELTSPLEGYEVWKLMFLLLEASVWEEVIARMLLIGVPMLLIVIASETKDREWWRYLTGGFGINKVTVILILFSSVIFGIAHVPGWDLWKAVPTFVSGLALGYLFVKYGIYASIALHFLVDYLSFSDWLGGSDVLAALAMLGVIALCLPYIWVYFKRGVLYLRTEL